LVTFYGSSNIGCKFTILSFIFVIAGIITRSQIFRMCLPMQTKQICLMTLVVRIIRGRWRLTWTEEQLESSVRWSGKRSARLLRIDQRTRRCSSVRTGIVVCCWQYKDTSISDFKMFQNVFQWNSVITNSIIMNSRLQWSNLKSQFGSSYFELCFAFLLYGHVIWSCSVYFSRLISAKHRSQ
jgi:hypothetical protein